MKTTFYLYLVAMFLNAFVDLGHKILIQNTIFKLYDGSEQILFTAIVNLLILLPFVLFFSSSGYISDRFRKKNILVLMSFIAIIITLGITYCYYHGFFKIAFFLTFLLAIQSAFYSPAKYGLIKELLGEKYLIKGNAYVQSLTIVAILFSTVLFSYGFEHYFSTLSITINEVSILKSFAPLGWVLVALSTVEMLLTLMIKADKVTLSRSKFEVKSFFTFQLLRKNLEITLQQKKIKMAILALSLFFAVSQVLLASIAAYLKDEAAVESAFLAQIVTASAAIGIIIGSIIFNLLSRHTIRIGLLPIAAIMIFLVLLLLGTTTNLYLLALLMFSFGFFGGWIIIALNALIQNSARSQQLGTTLAGNNFIQNIVMSLFLGFTILFSLFNISANILFILLAFIAITGSFKLFTLSGFNREQLILTTLFNLRYHIQIRNAHRIPTSGAVLLLGNHVSFIDWVFLLMSTKRRVRFVIERQYCFMRFFTFLCKRYKGIPISELGSREALTKVADALNDGDIVCLFPEGGLSTIGKIRPLKKGYEIILKKCHVEVVIIPFYLQGLWGSLFSRAPKKTTLNHPLFRRVNLNFGDALPHDIQADELYQKILLTKHKLD
jgi:acyl-[acyl-carrier-protein]-phospholipid O-acyltransferase / long-chain-fatty-acid--[acyl-carrier-protein] ligase